MAQQEDGWPLGLQPLNARVGLVRNHDRNGSISFSTLLTASSSTQSSSDLDTESTGSFFRDNSITLGTLMGVSSILELSRRSMRLRPPETLREKKSCKSKPWLFSFCSKLSTDAVSMSNTPSLGHFLEAERRATSIFRQSTAPPAPSGPGAGSMFVGERSNREMFEQGSGYGAPLLLSCLCRQLIE